MNRLIASVAYLLVANLAVCNAQEGTFPSCSICPQSTPEIGLPDLELPPGTVGITTEGATCSQLEEAAQNGDYSPAVCSIIRLVVGTTCGCFAMPTVAPTNSPVSATPTMAPVVGVTGTPTNSPVTGTPSMAPVEAPVIAATDTPTMAPLQGVTSPPSLAPVEMPAPEPTLVPVTIAPEPTESPVVAVPEPTEAPIGVVSEPTASPVVTVPEPTEAPIGVVPEPTEAPVGVVPEPTEAPIGVVPAPTEAPIGGVPEPTGAPVAVVLEPTEEPVGVGPVPTEIPVAMPASVTTNIAINVGVGEMSTDDEEAFMRACASFLQTNLEGASNVTCSIVSQSLSTSQRRLQDGTNQVIVEISVVSDSIEDEDALGESAVTAINGNKVGFIENLQTESGSEFFNGVTEATLSAEIIADPVIPEEPPVEADRDGLSSGGIAGIVIAVIAVLAALIAFGYFAGNGKEKGPARVLLEEDDEEESVMIHPPPNPLVIADDFPKASVASQFAIQAAARGAGSMLSVSSVDGGESEVEGFSMKAPGSTVDNPGSVDVVSATSGALSSLRHNMIARTVLIPPGKLGIVVDTTLEGPVVNKVNEASPVEGLLFAGDIIVAVDDVDTRAMSASAIYSLMKKTSDVRRKITVLSEDVAA